MKLPKEYHDLREYAIGYYRAQAGYIAPNMPISEDFSDIKLWFYDGRWDFGYSAKFKPIVYSKFECELCYECRRQMMRLFQTLVLHPRDYDYNCNICGLIVYDEIPF